MKGTKWYCAASRVAWLALIVAVSGCVDETPTESVLLPQGDQQLQRQLPSAEAIQVVHWFAAALADSAVRQEYFRATASSAAPEGKLHFNSYLRSDGAAWARAMAAAAGRSRTDLLAHVDRLGALETYLPVDAHRANWTGGAQVIVAIQLQEEGTPYGVTLGGLPVPLSLAGPPAVPTIVLVPAESFDADGIPYDAPDAPVPGMDVLQDECLTCLEDGGGDDDGGGGGTSDTWLGLWVNEVHVGDHSNYEPWTKGNPEFEMWIENATADPRAKIVCAEEDYSVEPYRWNMDGDDYYSAFLLAHHGEVPVGDKLVISMWEDDDERCVQKDDKDYVALTVKAINDAGTIYDAIKKRETSDTTAVVVAFFDLYSTLRSIATGGDDYVGVSAGYTDISTTETKVLLKNQEQINVGWMMLQWKRDTAH